MSSPAFDPRSNSWEHTAFLPSIILRKKQRCSTYVINSLRNAQKINNWSTAICWLTATNAHTEQLESHLPFPLTISVIHAFLFHPSLNDKTITIIVNHVLCTFFLKPGFHIVVSVVSVVRKKFIGQTEFILSCTTSCIRRFFCIEHLYGRFP